MRSWYPGWVAPESLQLGFHLHQTGSGVEVLAMDGAKDERLTRR